MDPEVLSDKPGACPICGMALEPRVADLTDAANPELVDMTRRFWIGVTFGAPVFLLTMADMLSGETLSHRVGLAWVNWISFALATPVVLWCGRPFFHRMRASIVNRSPNMFTLIGLGVGTAYGYSAVATIAPNLFPAGFRMHGAVDTYFDTTVVITVLVLLGQVLELRAPSHRRGDSPAARPRAQDRAARQRRPRRRCAAGTSAGGRSAARASWREDSGRRRRCRRRRRSGRVDGHR